MNIETLAEKACDLANDDLPSILYEIQDHMVRDIDGDPCGPLSDDERLLAAYLAGQQSNTKEGK